MKGFFVEIASLIALIGGIYGAIYFSYFASDFLKDYVEWSENYIALTAFAVTFIAIVVAVSSLGKVFTKMANFVALGMINKLLGGVFALLKSVLNFKRTICFFFAVKWRNSFYRKRDIRDLCLIHTCKENCSYTISKYH